MKITKRARALPVERSAHIPPGEAPDPATAAALKLWVVLARAAAAVGEHSKADIQSNGLTPAEFGLLEALYHKGPQLLGEVQKRVLVSSGGITFLVDRLAKRGLVERQACATDGRARYAALTPEGVRLMRDVFPAHAKAIRKAVSGLDSREKKLATALLRKLGLYAASRAPDQ